MLRKTLRCEATGKSYNRVVARCTLPDGRSLLRCDRLRRGGSVRSVLATVPHGGVPLASLERNGEVSICMARVQKLKVYRTAAGFNDAYVAAPSQKAALAAWGSDKDLFARGVAELVTDPALTAEPLASPGVVVKHSRGTTAEQINAMPDSEPRTARRGGSSLPETSKQPTKPKPAPKPKPSSAELEAAENALETVTADYDSRMKALADREAKLTRDRLDLEKRRQEDVGAAEAAVKEARQAYDGALRQWRKSKTDA